MLSERDEIAGGDFHYCVWRMRYGARGKNQGLNEGTDLCQRLAVNALGQRWIRTQTHAHTHTQAHTQPLVCFSAATVHTGFVFPRCR